MTESADRNVWPGATAGNAKAEARSRRTSERMWRAGGCGGRSAGAAGTRFERSAIARRSSMARALRTRVRSGDLPRLSAISPGVACLSARVSRGRLTVRRAYPAARECGSPSHTSHPWYAHGELPNPLRRAKFRLKFNPIGAAWSKSTLGDCEQRWLTGT